MSHIWKLKKNTSCLRENTGYFFFLPLSSFHPLCLLKIYPFRRFDKKKTPDYRISKQKLIRKKESENLFAESRTKHMGKKHKDKG